jgi:hypothetical protein
MLIGVVRSAPFAVPYNLAELVKANVAIAALFKAVPLANPGAVTAAD